MVGACIYWELHIENHFMLGYASKEQYVLARAWRRDAMRIFDALYQEVL